jgi:hypothetical protein
MGSVRAELAARWPVAVYLDLADLDTLAEALAGSRPRGRQGAAWSRTARKIGRARDRKRERARKAARR